MKSTAGLNIIDGWAANEGPAAHSARQTWKLQIIIEEDAYGAHRQVDTPLRRYSSFVKREG